MNDKFDPPLSEAEVVKTAQSAWRYEEEGRNLIGRGRFAVSALDEIETFSSRPDAFYLLNELRARFRLPEPFALSPKPMARRYGWSVKRLRKARDNLLARGKIIQVHKGGNGPHDPDLYRLPR
jgi:hypothetical protein